MRDVPASLEEHYETDATTTAWGMRIERADAEVFGWTSADRDKVIDGDEYLSAPGMSVASLVSSAGLAVDNTEATLLEGGVVTREDMLAGRWDGARFELFKYNWADLDPERDIHMAGTLGQWKKSQTNAWVAELRGPQQRLQQTIADPSTKTCRYRLGSTAMPEGLCMKDLTSFTVTGSVSSVASKQQFTDSSRTEGDDYFGEGIVTWTSGLNNGLLAKVKTYASSVFGLALPLVFPIEVGDTYTAIAGCRKRLEEDCRDKFDNVLNFGGEPHRPTQDDMTKGPEADVE